MDASYEEAAWKEDQLLLGIDEVGMGNICGYCMVGFAIFPTNYNFNTKLSSVNDSKRLSKKKLVELEPLIKEECLYWATVEISPEMIDSRSAYHAVLDTIKMRVDTDESLKNINYRILFDGNHRIPDVNVRNDFLIKGDTLCYSIAAASILAKTANDRIICGLDEIHPEYDWKNNKGYGTKKHIDGIKKFGLTKYHRKSYCKKWM